MLTRGQSPFNRRCGYTPLVRVGELLHHVLDFCYPGICASCDANAPAGGTVCETCAAELDAMTAAGACAFCAMPLANDGAPCPYCMGKGHFPFERIIRLGVFADPLKNLIHQMKYHRRWPLGEMLTDRLIETERAKGLLTETQVLVPVPLHVRRHIERGYNQAEVIARRIGKRCDIPVIHATRRIRNTETQTNIHAHAKRIANVRGAFALTKSAAKLRGKHVIVIDDVMTVGATLAEVGRTLKKAEPASLCAIVLAVADPKRRGFEVI